jgi:hypothetical protein
LTPFSLSSCCITDIVMVENERTACHDRGRRRTGDPNRIPAPIRELVR